MEPQKLSFVVSAHLCRVYVFLNYSACLLHPITFFYTEFSRLFKPFYIKINNNLCAYITSLCAGTGSMFVRRWSGRSSLAGVPRSTWTASARSCTRCRVCTRCSGYGTRTCRLQKLVRAYVLQKIDILTDSSLRL